MREGEVGVAGTQGSCLPHLTHSPPLPAAPSSVPHVRLGQRRPHHPGRVSKCKVCSRLAGPGAPHAPRSAAWRRPELTVCLPLRQVVEELLSGNPHIEKESARSIADGAMMEAASVCVGQMVSARGPCPHPPLRRQSPARCGSVLPEGLEGRGRTWPAHRSSWAWRRALLRGLAAFLSHQKSRSEVSVLGGRTRQARLGFGGPQTLLGSLPGPTGSTWHSARPSRCTAWAHCH